MPLRALVCTDGSPHSRDTARVVIRLAEPLGLKVQIAYALDLQRLEYKMIPDFQVEMIRQGAKRSGEEILKKEKETYRREGVDAEPRLLVGAPGPALCDLARREGADLVIAGRRGHGDLQDILFGTVSSHLIHHCPIPLLLVKSRPDTEEPLGKARPVRALVALDDSPASQRCIEYLLSLPTWAEGLDLTLLRVVNPNRPGLEHLPSEARFAALEAFHREGAALLEEKAQQLRTAGFRVDTRVEQGSAGKTICRVGQEDGYDLLVVGRRGAEGPAGVLSGSVCHFVMHHCSTHVLLVP